MQISPIDASATERLAATHGCTIGQWNELKLIEPIPSWSISSPSAALPLYNFAMKLAKWIASSESGLLQLDNSTFPTDDEVLVFERVAFCGRKWNPTTERSFLLSPENPGEQSKDEPIIALLIYFSLLFQWHTHMTFGGLSRGKKLALLDGVAHLFGNMEDHELGKLV